MTNKLKGGLSDKMSLEGIARKHSVFLGTIKQAVEAGIKVEMEHTNDKGQAEEIARDHVSEDPEYYKKLKKMEAKEQTDASCSGSFESPMTTTILKRDIHKLAEQMDAGVSAGAMYDGPIGTAGPSSPMDKSKKKKRKDPLALDEKTKSGSVTAASTKDMISTKKGFPRFGGPKTKFVEINPKCKTYPYCNQGADSDGAWKTPKNIKLVEGMNTAIEAAAKKYGISIKEVERMVMKEAYNLPIGIDMSPASTWGRNKPEKNYSYELTTIDPQTGEPIPLHYKTQNESDFAKLKLLLHGSDVRFTEDKHQLEGGAEVKKPYDPLATDDDDDIFDDADDIFANMK